MFSSPLVSTTIVSLLICLSLLTNHILCAENTIRAALTPSNQVVFANPPPKDAVATAEYTPTFTTKGFSELHLKANPSYSVNQQAQAVGYLEGYLSAKEILPFYHNQHADWGFKPHEPFPEKLNNFMRQNYKWVQDQVANQSSSSPYWRHAQIVLLQLDGLAAGYAQAYSEGIVSELLSPFQLFMLNAAGDLENLIPALKVGKTLKMQIMDEEPLTDCSALIRVLLDEKSQKPVDIFAGHTTWRGFQIIWSMYKSVQMTFDNGETRTVSYSSSPGFISSKDDYYIVNGIKDSTPTAHMVVMETTNSIFNTTLYDLLTPKSVLCWMRSTIANAMTSGGKQWTETFSRYNSGTYDDQFMVLDYTRFSVGSQIASDTLWIVEQIPGECKSGDVSYFLRDNSYWPSYNIPFFKEIYEKSGYVEARKVFGDDMDYLKCPRRQIFDREAVNVSSLESFGAVLQFNDYKNDPLSKGDPAKSIASRYDLRTPEQKPHPFGGIDTKSTSFSLSQKGSSRCIGGPTHQSLPPFEWTDEWKEITHEGQPQKFDFDWMYMG